MSTMAKPWKHPDSGIYYHRIEVPKDIRKQFPTRWIKTSLNTRTFSEAKRLFAVQYAETQAKFAQARSRVSLTPKDIEVLAQRWFEDTLSHIEDEGAADLYIITHTDNGVAEPISDQIADALERGYTAQLRLVGNKVSALLGDNNILLTEGSDEHKALTAKLCWRFFELSKIALDRYYDDWSTTSDKFTSRAGESLSTEKTQKVKQKARKSDYKSLGDIVASFVTYKADRGDWDDKTKADVVGVCDQLIEYLGVNTDPSTITREQFRDFSTLLSQLPTNYTRIPRLQNLSFTDLIDIAADEDLKTASAGTVRKKFVFIKSLTKYASAEELVDKDRALGITIPKGKPKVRNPYATDQLNAIFASTKDAKRPSDYWVPRIGLTTGMRSNEILQLGVADVREVAGVWCLDINQNIDPDSGKPKKTKTDNSCRLIPVPQVLIKSGFLDYVKSLDDGSRLFPCVLMGTEGSYSSVYSKRFNLLIHNLGLKPEDDEGLMRDFHNLRHTFRVNGRANLMLKEHADFIGGWRDQDDVTQGDKYGAHFESFIHQLKSSIDVIDYKGLRF